MNRRKIILLSLIAILSVTYIFQIVFSTSGKIKSFALKEKPDQIIIQNKSGLIELNKSNDLWLLSGDKPAKESGSKYIEDFISDIKTVDTVSKKSEQEQLDKYGLSNPITITASKGNKTLLKVLVGKTASTKNQTYIMFEGKKEIYLASGNFNSVFEISENELLDMTLYSVSENEVYKIQIYGIENKLEFEAEKAGENANFAWKVTKGSADFTDDKIDQTKFAEWIKSISELKAENWADSFEMEKENHKVVLYAGEKTITVKLYYISAAKENPVLCLCSENNFPAEISGNNCDRLVSGYENCLKD